MLGREAGEKKACHQETETRQPPPHLPLNIGHNTALDWLAIYIFYIYYMKFNVRKEN